MKKQIYAKFLLGCQQFQWAMIWSVIIWTLPIAQSQAATEFSTSAEEEVDHSWVLSSVLTAEEFTSYESEVRMASVRVDKSWEKAFFKEIKNNTYPACCLLSSVPLRYRFEPTPFLIAAPENFNPDLRIPPPPPPPPPKPPKPSKNISPPSTKQVLPLAVLENIQTDFRDDTDNFGLENLFIESTANFRLINGNHITFKTGLDHFSQSRVKSITNIPLQFGWVGKIGDVTLQTSAGVDLFDHLPAALNLNAKAETPILPAKVSKSGKLLSVITLSANLEQGPYKSSARTLNNQITAWRFGPDLYWQINRDTSFFSSLRLGRYNDGNSEVQSFSRLEHKLGQFILAANLFTWSYERDLERKSGYFSPPDFLVYNAELGWEGDVFKFLRCRLSANLGQQRLKAKFDNANSYQTRCTVKLSPNLEVDLGYTFSNVHSHETAGSGYGGNSLAGQLRVKF